MLALNALDTLHAEQALRDAAARARASLVFWQAEISVFYSYDSTDGVWVSAYFKSKDKAEAWLLAERTKLAPLADWTLVGGSWEWKNREFDLFDVGLREVWTED